MSVLKVRCPETGREISTGIEIDPESFAALPDKLPVSNCPLCGLDHAWLKCDARFLEDPSASGLPGAGFEHDAAQRRGLSLGSN